MSPIVLLFVLGCSILQPCHSRAAVEARRATLEARGGDDGRSVLAGMTKLEPVVEGSLDASNAVLVGFSEAPPEVWARGSEIFIVVEEHPNIEHMVECGCRNSGRGSPPVQLPWVVAGSDPQPETLVITDQRPLLVPVDEARCPPAP